MRFERYSWWWSWRAKRIADPLGRLQYLRGATGKAGRRARGPGRARTLVAALSVALLLAPGQGGPAAAGRAGGPPDTGLWRQPVADRTAEVWMVERQEGFELYSNGLRVETRATVHNERRDYAWVERSSGAVRTGGVRPVGILFHSTESHMAPFAEGHNTRLQRVGRWLLDYVRERRSYHYLVDRFGRVHRVVAEQDAADHAGMSLWADRDRVYFGLNHSFLGVALESETAPGSELSGAVTPAQLRATRALVEMLRHRYQIPAPNCLTHAQASINRHSMRIGNHTDWAANFPFAEIGLPDNYEQPIPAVYLFGLGYDQQFLESTGLRMWKGLAASEDLVRQHASRQGLTVAASRGELKKEFKRIAAALPARDEASEQQP